MISPTLLLPLGLLFALPLAWFSYMGGLPNKLTMCKLILKLLLPDLCTWKSQKIVKSLVTIPKDWASHVSKNIYGGKDSGRVWYLCLRAQLESIGFKVSQFKGHATHAIYTLMTAF